MQSRIEVILLLPNSQRSLYLSYIHWKKNTSNTDFFSKNYEKSVRLYQICCLKW